MTTLETVIVQHQHEKIPRKERISRAVRIAIDAMVFEALPRDEAAKKAGITDLAMYKALRKPSVAAYRNTQMNLQRTSAASRTIAKAEKLMDSAESEHVQADMTKWLAALEGIAPLARSEITHTHQGHIAGLTIVFGAPPAPGDDALLIGQELVDHDKAKLIKSLPQPVRHPAQDAKG